MESGFARAVRDEAWDSYQHEFASSAPARPEDDEPAINLNTDLMRLAAGGGAG